MGKEQVFWELQKNEGAYVSGETLSNRLGISRAAVWKSIRALRRDGYAIDALAGSGYRLEQCPDTLSEREIRRYLGTTELVGRTIDCFESIGSTNTYLKNLDDAPDGLVAVAQEQTAGRGRRDRRFESAAGKGVYLSVLLRPQMEASQLMSLTGLGAVAVCDAIERAAGLRPQIKWTNDLILNGKKLAGILTELSFAGESGAVQHAVMGVGVNVTQKKEDFSDETGKIATSLAAETGKNIPRARLAAAMIEEFDRLWCALRTGDTAAYLAAYRRDCVTIGAEVQLLWQDTREKVRALDVDEQFGLVVRRENGAVEVIRTGEVSVRGLYGYIDEEEK